MKITYEDKVAVDPVSAYPRKNKITAEDLNEIKEVVNANADNPNAVTLYSSSRAYEDIPAETVITLSGSIADYDRLTVYGKSDSNIYCSCDIYHPAGGEYFTLMAGEQSGESSPYFYQHKMRKFNFDTTNTLTYRTGRQASFQMVSGSTVLGYVQETNNIKIYAIVGYK